jgi:hypothetical protein
MKSERHKVSENSSANAVLKRVHASNRHSDELEPALPSATSRINKPKNFAPGGVKIGLIESHPWQRK